MNVIVNIFVLFFFLEETSQGSQITRALEKLNRVRVWEEKSHAVCISNKWLFVFHFPTYPPSHAFFLLVTLSLVVKIAWRVTCINLKTNLTQTKIKCPPTQTLFLVRHAIFWEVRLCDAWRAKFSTSIKAVPTWLKINRPCYSSFPGSSNR